LRGYQNEEGKMKRILLPLAVVMLLALAVPAFAEWELGLGFTPAQNQSSTDPNALQGIVNFHVGYAWNILYFSWDSFAMPDYWVYNATSYVDPTTGWYYPGSNVPGFLNMFDVGVRLVLRPIIFYAELGPNVLYLYGGQFYRDPNGGSGVGVNGRIGAGVKFGWWGINLSGTQVFASWNDMRGAFDQLFNHGNSSYLTDGSMISLNFALYF
jgi:hypothetical protein